MRAVPILSKPWNIRRHRVPQCVCVVIPAISVKPGGLDPRDALGWELPIPNPSPVSHRICWAGNSELTQSQATAEY